MAIELTGPDTCAECGTEITLAMVQEGEAGQVFLSVGERIIAVPGLAQCTNCAGEVMVGERVQNVTPEKAAAFLSDVFAPKLAEHMTATYNRFQDVARVIRTLNPHMEVELAMFEVTGLPDDVN